MVKTVVVTEKIFSDTLQSVSEKLIGEQTGLVFIGTDDSDPKVLIDKVIKENRSKDGTLFLTDRFGTKYSNYCLELSKNSEEFEVLSGINIPMIISASKYSIKAETSLQNLVDNVKRDSVKSILSSSDFFGSFEKN